MADDNRIFGLNTIPFIVPPGATLALLVEGVQGQGAQLLKYGSGGSCQIIGVTLGTTMTAAQLVSAGNSGGYLMGTSEAVSIDGAARYYLMATGSTATIMQIRGLTAGY